MAAYFTSDVHLRLDFPKRGARFAQWVEQLDPADSLVVAGDLCDFWFASRQLTHAANPLACPGLKALAERRRRGGSVTIMGGNHDLWLGPFYEQTLGARFVHEPLEVEAYGLRVHVVHGHLLGARSAWKGMLETRAFLAAFRYVPGQLAHALERGLEQSNECGRAASDRRHLAAFRHYADQLESRADLALFGHIHHPHDDSSGRVRAVVLGSWLEGSSYLKIDQTGATLVASPAGIASRSGD